MSRAARLGLLALCLGATGCRTFNYTEEDLARERRWLAEGYANGGLGGGMGAGGINIAPRIGNIQCPGLGACGVSPGK